MMNKEDMCNDQLLNTEENEKKDVCVICKYASLHRRRPSSSYTYPKIQFNFEMFLPLSNDASTPTKAHPTNPLSSRMKSNFHLVKQSQIHSPYTN